MINCKGEIIEYRLNECECEHCINEAVKDCEEDMKELEGYY